MFDRMLIVGDEVVGVDQTTKKITRHPIVRVSRNRAYATGLAFRREVRHVSNLAKVKVVGGAKSMDSTLYYLSTKSLWGFLRKDTVEYSYMHNLMRRYGSR